MTNVIEMTICMMHTYVHIHTCTYHIRHLLRIQWINGIVCTTVSASVHECGGMDTMLVGVYLCVDHMKQYATDLIVVDI